jgi:hypothetical protein
MSLLAFTFGAWHGLLGLIILVLDIVAIVGLLGGSTSVLHKVFWIVAIILFPFLGVLAYFLLGRSRLGA